MKTLAPDIHRLDQWPGPFINVYLVGDILIDSGTRGARRRIFNDLGETEISMLALTHAHPDHQGVAADICELRNVPLACHAGDVDAMEGRAPLMEKGDDGVANRLVTKLWAGPPRRVDKALNEGDQLGELEVIHAPGHSRGQVIFFRPSDRVAICGDVIRNISYLTGRRGLRPPPDGFTYDPAENRRSIRKLAALEPSLILPGHGPEVDDMAAFRRFVDSLPSD